MRADATYLSAITGTVTRLPDHRRWGSRSSSSKRHLDTQGGIFVGVGGGGGNRSPGSVESADFALGSAFLGVCPETKNATFGKVASFWCWWSRRESNPWVCRERRPRPWLTVSSGYKKATFRWGGLFVGVGGGGGNRTPGSVESADLALGSPYLPGTKKPPSDEVAFSSVLVEAAGIDPPGL